MSTTTLEFRLDLNDAPTDPTSVKFSDPTGTYGVRRTDTNAIVVADGTDLVRISEGVFSYTFTDPAQDLTYQYWIEFVIDGDTTRIERQKSMNSPSVVSSYFSLDDFIRRFGAKNVRIASNKDNANNDYDYAAIQQAIDYAQDQISNTLRGGVLAVPLNFTAWAGVIPPTVKEWAMIIAYEYLYNARGLEDRDKVGNKLTKAKNVAYQEMAFVKAGLLQLNAAPASATSGTLASLAESYVSYYDVLIARAAWRDVDGVPRVQWCWTGSPTIP